MRLRTTGRVVADELALLVQLADVADDSDLERLAHLDQATLHPHSSEICSGAGRVAAMEAVAPAQCDPFEPGTAVYGTGALDGEPARVDSSRTHMLPWALLRGRIDRGCDGVRTKAPAEERAG